MTEINDRKPEGLPDVIRHYIDGEFVDSIDGDTFEVADQITGETYTWAATETGNFVRLAPEKNVAHIFRLPEVPKVRREALAYRQISDHDYRP